MQIALQDHWARSLQLGGGRQRQPAQRTGEPLTLAQRCKLVAAPPPVLTKAEWGEVHNRHRLRQHSCGECPICCEAFRNEDQVRLPLYLDTLCFLAPLTQPLFGCFCHTNNIASIVQCWGSFGRKQQNAAVALLEWR